MHETNRLEDEAELASQMKIISSDLAQLQVDRYFLLLSLETFGIYLMFVHCSGDAQQNQSEIVAAVQELEDLSSTCLEWQSRAQDFDTVKSDPAVRKSHDIFESIKSILQMTTDRLHAYLRDVTNKLFKELWSH